MNAKYYEKYMIQQIQITFSFLFQMFDRGVAIQPEK